MVTVEKSVEFKLYKDGVDVTNKGLSYDDRFKVKNGTVVTFKQVYHLPMLKLQMVGLYL